ncbi:hypothetical protein SL003B_0624 [Polymorphum gilvum SL003B-26A1]|uniref:Uncharacterized protein n=1 Tax=Polymorphum gilvum (strain LMG 25793 / CGMCC 1.9160 / SL003B-26A1) TaxID=991905 RepID=F2J4W5_POLGS|nr:hypothetical protein SL003B_0624 [Polymorphum gilvum SL003B-26A1]
MGVRHRERHPQGRAQERRPHGCQQDSPGRDRPLPEGSVRPPGESTKRAEGSFLAYWEKTLGQYSLAYITADTVSDKLAELAAAGDGRRKPPEEGER